MLATDQGFTTQSKHALRAPSTTNEQTHNHHSTHLLKAAAACRLSYWTHAAISLNLITMPVFDISA